MQSRTVYTFPARFPEFPKTFPMVSRLQRGVGAQFGIVVGPPVDDGKVTDTMYSFFTIDMEREDVVHSPLHVLHMAFFLGS